jgi:hypothetical protein
VVAVPTQAHTPAETLGRLDVNHLVRVNIAGSASWGSGEAAEEVRTRVEDITERCADHARRYTIAAPRYAGDVELPAAGTPCTLEWPGPHGIWILPVTFVDDEVIGDGLRVWTVEVLAPARQTERRSFVRVDWELPLSVEPLSAAELRQLKAIFDGQATMLAEGLNGPLQGTTVNISEGGIRCQLPGPMLCQGVGVAISVEIAGHDFRLPARVQWIRPTGMHGLHEFDAALAFDDPGRHGDRLRPLLFAEQLRIRRAGLA